MSSWSGWGQKCPADETYPNCVSDLRYLRDKDSLPTDSVQFALTETAQLDPRYEPRLTRNQFIGELLHRMWSKKMENLRQKFLKTNAFIPNPLSGVDVTRGQDCRQFYFDGFVRYIAFYETGEGRTA